MAQTKKFIVRKKQYLNIPKGGPLPPGTIFEDGEYDITGQWQKVEPYISSPPPEESKEEKAQKPKYNAAMKGAPKDRAM